MTNKRRKILIDKSYLTKLKNDSKSLTSLLKDIRKYGLGLSEWERSRLQELVESGKILEMNHLDCITAFTAGTARRCCMLMVDVVKKAKVLITSKSNRKVEARKSWHLNEV